MTGLSDFLSMVEALVAAVEFDDGGVMVGKERVGGNGGLLSIDTLKKASRARLVLDRLKAAVTTPATATDETRRVVIEAMALCYRQAAEQGEDGWRAVEAAFPGTPADVIADAMVKATDAMTEAWWSQVERTIDVDLVRRALPAGGVQ